jgi:hypothetical protein
MYEVMQALTTIMALLKEIKLQLQILKQSHSETFKNNWIDGQDVMLDLNISKRTLQSLRDTGILPYSRINGKFYYKVADIEMLLEGNYSRNLKNECHD